MFYDTEMVKRCLVESCNLLIVSLIMIESKQSQENKILIIEKGHKIEKSNYQTDNEMSKFVKPFQVSSNPFNFL